MKRIDTIEAIKSGLRATALLIIAGLALAALVGEVEETTEWAWYAKTIFYKVVGVAGFWLVLRLHDHWRATDSHIRAEEEEIAKADEAMNPLWREEGAE